MVKNAPANAGDTGSIPGPGKLHGPQGNLACMPQTLMPGHQKAHVPRQEKPPQQEARAPQLESSPQLTTCAPYPAATRPRGSSEYPVQPKEQKRRHGSMSRTKLLRGHKKIQSGYYKALRSVRTTNPHDDSVRKGPPLRPLDRQGKFHTARKGPSEDSAQGGFCLEPRLSEPLQERKHGLGGHVHRSDRQRATRDFQLRDRPPAEPSAPRLAPCMQWTSRLTGWWSAAGSACKQAGQGPSLWAWPPWRPLAPRFITACSALAQAAPGNPGASGPF